MGSFGALYYLVGFGWRDIVIECANTPSNMSLNTDTELVPVETSNAHMTIEISKDSRKEAITSIERYFLENMEEKIGNIAAGALLGYFLEEVGPLIYNKAVADVQERLQLRVSELDIDHHEEEFQYWRKFDRQRKGKK